MASAVSTCHLILAKPACEVCTLRFVRAPKTCPVGEAEVLPFTTATVDPPVPPARGKAGLWMRHLRTRERPLRQKMRALCALRTGHRPPRRCVRAGPPLARESWINAPLTVAANRDPMEHWNGPQTTRPNRRAQVHQGAEGAKPSPSCARTRAEDWHRITRDGIESGLAVGVELEAQRIAIVTESCAPR